MNKFIKSEIYEMVLRGSIWGRLNKMNILGVVSLEEEEEETALLQKRKECLLKSFWVLLFNAFSSFHSDLLCNPLLGSLPSSSFWWDRRKAFTFPDHVPCLLSSLDSVIG